MSETTPEYIPVASEPEDEYYEDPNYNPENDEVDLSKAGLEGAHYGELPPDPEATA